MTMKYCPHCHFGKVEQKSLLYIQLYRDNLIVVGRLPAFICDTCGEKTYDIQAMESLQRLLRSGRPETTLPVYQV